MERLPAKVRKERRFQECRVNRLRLSFDTVVLKRKCMHRQLACVQIDTVILFHRLPLR
jgi:hypothetical protein